MNRPQLILTSLILNWTTSITERLNIATLLCMMDILVQCAVVQELILDPSDPEADDQKSAVNICSLVFNAHSQSHLTLYSNVRQPLSLAWINSASSVVHLLRCLLERELWLEQIVSMTQTVNLLITIETKLRVRVRLRLVQTYLTTDKRYSICV